MTKRIVEIEFGYDVDSCVNNCEWCINDDLDISAELDEVIIEHIKLLYTFKLCRTVNLVIHDDEITSVYNPEYTFFVDTKKERFFINAALSAKRASIIFDRILMIYGDTFAFEDVIYKAWDGVKIGDDAEEAYQELIYLDTMFDNNTLEFFEE